MAEYSKSEIMGGKWVIGKELKSGVKAKLKSEVHPSPSQFKDPKTGEIKMQDVGKILIQGDTEQKNISVNKASISALVDAFGKNSNDWVDKLLTIETLKMSVGGKMVTAVYLVPEGYSLAEDNNGYMVITSNNAEKVLMGDVDASDGEEDINPDDIPF
ncbi:MAG: hypothetical protein WAV09_03585 [Minisyncoccia bacterium]